MFAFKFLTPDIPLLSLFCVAVRLLEAGEEKRSALLVVLDAESSRPGRIICLGRSSSVMWQMASTQNWQGEEREEAGVDKPTEDENREA